MIRFTPPRDIVEDFGVQGFFFTNFLLGKSFLMSQVQRKYEELLDPLFLMLFSMNRLRTTITPQSH